MAVLIATLALGAAEPTHAQAIGANSNSARPALSLTGQVLLPGGHPAQGVVVVSSAGGLATADEDRVFVLELPPGEYPGALHLTAVTNGPRGALTAEAEIPESRAWGEQGNQTLMLAASSGCQEDWLPTFGGMPVLQHGNSERFALDFFDTGAGPALIVGGRFAFSSGGDSFLAPYRDASTSPCGTFFNTSNGLRITWQL